MKKTGVSFGLAALLTLSCLVSCITTDNTLGSALVPDNQDISIRTATIDLPVGLKMADSLQTSVSQSATVGAIRSARYGLFHCDAAVSVTSAYDSVEWGRNPSVHSLEMVLVSDSTLVIDATQLHIPQNLYLHRLRVDLDSTMIYNNSLTAADYDPEVLNEGRFVYTGGSSISVPLNKKLGEELFQIPMATRDSAELFMKAFPGFYLRCDDPEEGLLGGRLNVFDLSSSYINLTYDYDDEDGVRKRAIATFLMGMKRTVNVCTSGARSMESPLATDGIFMEGLCGIKPHIDARELRDAIARWAADNQISLDNLIIAKATLSFPFEYSGDGQQFECYSSSLFPCKRVHKDVYVRYTPLVEIEDESMESGDIDRSNLCYDSNVSIYLQKLVRTDRSQLTAYDDLWMMPYVSTYNSYTGETTFMADYFFYTQSELNGTEDLRHPVINLIYTTLK